MKKISLSKIEDGMVLARPITGPDGKILVAAGEPLRAGIGERLQRWGILNAYIRTDDEEEDDSMSEFSKRQIKKIEKTFCKVLDNHNMRTLHDELLKYFKGKE